MNAARAATKRRCAAKTRAGKPCKAWPLEGGKFCLAHSDAETRASVRFTPEAGKLGGRPPVPKATDLQRQLVERYALEMWESHLAALGFRAVFVDGVPQLERLEQGGAMLHGTSQRDGSINMSEYPDLGARQQAAERILNRALGTPRQSVALTGADGGALMLRVGQMLDAESAKLADELVERLAIEAEREDAGL